MDKLDRPSILDAMKYHAELKPNNEAFIFISTEGQREAITWSDLYLNSCRLAAGLRNLGAKPGEHVWIDQRNCPECLYAILGTMVAGAIPYCSRFMAQDLFDFKEVVSILKTCCLLVVDPANDANTWKEIKRYIKSFNDDGTVKDTDLPYVRYIVCNEIGRNGDTKNLQSIHQLIEANKFVEHFPLPRAEDLFMILKTSGTTGNPKFVKRAMFYDTEGGSGDLDLQQTRKTNIKIYCDLYFVRSAGRPTRNIAKGITRVLLLGSSDPDKYTKIRADIVVKECCKNISMFVKPWKMLFNDQYNFPDNWPVNVIFIGGQPMPPVKAKLLERAGKIISIGYSCVETSYISAYKVTDPEKFEQYCVGLVRKDVCLKIVDENGEEVPINTRGEILVKTKAMFKEYLNDEISTAQAFTTDGWFRTGDIGLMSIDNKLYVFGRKANRITLHDGIKIYPDEIESKFMMIKNVQDVIVVPIAQRSSHNKICACIVPTEDGLVESILRKNYEQLLSEIMAYDKRKAYKVDYYLFLKSIPEMSNFKTNRNLLVKIANKSFANL